MSEVVIYYLECDITQLITVFQAVFAGLLTDIQVFNKIIPLEKAVAYTSCQEQLNGNFGSWENLEHWKLVRVLLIN